MRPRNSGNAFFKLPPATVVPVKFLVTLFLAISVTSDSIVGGIQTAIGSIGAIFKSISIAVDPVSSSVQATVVVVALCPSATPAIGVAISVVKVTAIDNIPTIRPVPIVV